MRRLLLVLGLLGLASVASAQTTTTTTLPTYGRTGSFTLNRGSTVWGRFAALTTTNAPSTWIECGGSVNTLAIQWDIQGTATAILQWSLDEGTTWWTVTDSSTSSSTGQTVTNPSAIRYRPKLSACTDCAVSLTWRCTSSL